MHVVVAPPPQPPTSRLQGFETLDFMSVGFFCTVFGVAYFTITSPFLLPKIPKEDNSKVCGIPAGAAFNVRGGAFVVDGTAVVVAAVCCCGLAANPPRACVCVSLPCFVLCALCFAVLCCAVVGAGVRGQGPHVLLLLQAC